jgi:hypothetical protein
MALLHQMHRPLDCVEVRVAVVLEEPQERPSTVVLIARVRVLCLVADAVIVVAQDSVGDYCGRR